MPGGCLHLKNILKRQMKLKCVGPLSRVMDNAKKKKERCRQDGVGQKDSSKPEMKGLQDGSETCYYVTKR